MKYGRNEGVERIGRGVMVVLGGSVLLACGAEAGSTTDETGAQQAVWPTMTPGGRVETATYRTAAGDVPVTYEVVDGQRIFEGDIQLPSEDGPEYRSAGTIAQDPISERITRWTQGVMTIEPSGPWQHANISAAKANFEISTPLRFRESSTGNRVRFVSNNNGVCNSAVGMIGGVQIINLDLNACGSTAGVIHELGHAFGLFHEHSRPDRGNFVSINNACIQPNQAFNYDFFPTSPGPDFPGYAVTPYDFASVMHYSSNAWTATGCTCTAFNTSGCPMTTLNGGFITGGTVLSQIDIGGINALYAPWTLRRLPADYDGDGKADIAVWRIFDTQWHIKRSSNGAESHIIYGEAGDVPVSGRFDANSVSDLVVYRPSTGVWRVRPSGGGATIAQQWGAIGDLPVPGTYDNDLKSDFAVWRPSDGFWHIILSKTGQVFSQAWGAPGDVPVPCDYDGDTLTDIAIWRPSERRFHTISSRTGGIVSSSAMGSVLDFPVPGDYDGDGRCDFTTWNRINGMWTVRKTTDGLLRHQQWGTTGDVPVPADYIGNSRWDFAVFRPSDQFWHVLDANNGAVTSTRYGLGSDVLVP